MDLFGGDIVHSIGSYVFSTIVGQMLHEHRGLITLLLSAVTLGLQFKLYEHCANASLLHDRANALYAVSCCLLLSQCRFVNICFFMH